MAAQREQWGTRAGFILAAVGGAVGFGNVVRFPAFAAQNGGAAFVLLYLALVVLVGLPAFLAEMVVGRKGQADPVTSFGRLGGGKWKWAGALYVISALVFLGYYIVLNGWVLLYLVDVLQFQTLAEPVAFFEGVVEGPSTLVASFLVMALVVTVVSLGVQDGLERAGLILIPSLFLLLLGLAIYGLFQNGAGQGLSFFLTPRPGDLTPQAVVDAMGQAFFSLGVGIGFMVAYGSYLKPDSDMPEDAVTISIGDTLVALLAGLMVFPLLFSAGFQGAVTGEDVNPFSVLFVTLPATFAEIGGTLGVTLQALFFVALMFAVVSSAIAVLEVPVTFLVDRFEIPRRKAAILAGEIAMLPAIIAALSGPALTAMDRVVSTVALPLGGLLAVIFAGFVLKDAAGAVDEGAKLKVGRFVRLAWRTFVPIVMTIVMLYGLVVLFT